MCDKCVFIVPTVPPKSNTLANKFRLVYSLGSEKKRGDNDVSWIAVMYSLEYTASLFDDDLRLGPTVVSCLNLARRTHPDKVSLGTG
jgi:hypothetical protein